MTSSPPPGQYWTATRHPWSCVLFVLPLLALYELGLYWIGPAAPNEVRNGADVWLRGALASVGVSPVYGAPCLFVTVLLLWSFWRRQDRPPDQAGVWAGMAAESALFALVLFGSSQALWHVSTALPRLLTWTTAGRAPEPALEQIIRYLGAGLYEEALFRLLLYSALLTVFRLAEFPPVPGALLAALSSALLFAAAHHLGPHGEPWDGYIFSFRSLAGLYFAALFHQRGFGIAVGTHAGYDVLVGLLLRTV
jgi:membrane protease YdiL (CAAX protease family)